MLNIYKASAGSGKTYTLVKDYLTHLLGYKTEDGQYKLVIQDGMRHGSILALTFTNKATQEMKSRIINQLALLANDDEKSDYRDDLIKLFHCDKANLKQAAKKALEGILHNYPLFHINTIDAFFQLVLRTFAREAEIDGNYKIELKDKEVYADAIGQVIDKLNLSKPDKEDVVLVRRLKTLMQSQLDEGKTFNLFNRQSYLFGFLVKTIHDITNETFSLHKEEILKDLENPEKLNNFIQTLKKLQADTEDNLLIEVKKAKPIIETATIINSSLSKWIIAAEKNNGKNVLDGLKSTLEKVINDPIQSLTAPGRKKFKGEFDLSVLQQAAIALKNCYLVTSKVNFVLKNLHYYGLLGHILRQVKELGKERSSLMLKDTNEILAGILGEGDTPFVYERIGRYFKHILIDEFQDTSRGQWYNLSPLVEESLANGHDSLVIGDVKQAIYRFRNSDSSLLQNLHSTPQFHDQLTVRGEKIEENTNWRSFPEIVDFNNRFFTKLSHYMGCQEIYTGVTQQVSKKNIGKGGFIKIHFQKESPKDAEDHKYDSLIDDIRAQRKAGYAFSDIAILVRNRDQGVEVTEKLLSLTEDPLLGSVHVATSEVLKLNSCDSIRLIVSMLRYMVSPYFITKGQKGKDSNIARVIREYEFGLNNDMPVNEALERACEKCYQDAHEDSESDTSPVAATHYSGLFSTVEHIIKDTLTPQQRNADNAFILSFQDCVLDFCSRNDNDINTFLEWWDENKEELSISAPEDPGAINILTIHKAKGLEFKCVHVLPVIYRNRGDGKEWYPVKKLFPELSSESIPSYLPLPIQKEMRNFMAEEYDENTYLKELDELNVMYVAFTRACEQLCVTIPYGPTDMQKFYPDILQEMAQDNSASGTQFTYAKGDIYTQGAPTYRAKHMRKNEIKTHVLENYNTLARNDLWHFTTIDKDSKN